MIHTQERWVYGNIRIAYKQKPKPRVETLSKVAAILKTDNGYTILTITATTAFG